jgi:NAD-dependent deacetylase sirtuin 4
MLGEVRQGLSAAERDAVAELSALLSARRTVVLTGAGISTESGIPDYRGPGTRARAKDPMRFAEFTRSDEGRARYWSRAMVGWPAFRAAEPNRGHLAVAALERAGRITSVITQNVDGLHQRAGTQSVIELHGSLHTVRCLECGALEPRQEVQARLCADNPTLRPETIDARPDGDAELPPEWTDGFVVPQCLRCGGVLKPDVVYFGETVPPSRVQQAYAWVDAAEALLVVGSSLAVFSGYRFVRRAAELGHPIAIVNLGETRGDPYATMRIDASAGAVLSALAGDGSSLG